MPNLVGIGLSQVPTNSMLGGMAYQDPEHASIKDLDLKNLSQINSEIADTATHVFLYDTSKDSDGGAWRKRTTHTSWYNETLGTATRGTRKEFPSVAVLVLSANKLTIYDGDDPDLPMWMEAYQYVNGGSGGTTTNWHGGSGTFSSVAASNGIIICGASGGCRNLHFVNDRMSLFYTPSSGNYTQLGGISDRNDSYTAWSPSDQYYAQLVSAATNDVAMTVLPNAPIDSATGLPVPTIAVATDGGTSVIKDDGSVVDLTNSQSSYENCDFVDLVGDEVLLSFEQTSQAANARRFWIHSIPSSDTTVTSTVIAQGSADEFYKDYNPSFSGNALNYHTYPTYKTTNNVLLTSNDFYLGLEENLAIINRNKNSDGGKDGMLCGISTSYNTGWMHGNCKGAFLSDTDATNKTNGQTDPDRSVNNNALNVIGTITKSAVATGADLVGYSPSSNTSYLEQPYNSALDYGTGDMYYSMWVYANSSDSFSNNTYIFERSSISDTSNRRIEARMTTSTRVEIYANGQTLDNNVPVPANAWYKLDILRRSGEAFVYVNGEYHSSTTGGAATGSLTDTSAKLVIGNRAYFATRQYGFPSNSKIALFRTGASAPSAEQIKKIYEDEKMLFQENAACTLHGSSDAVTALAYDEVTEQLHVGTSSGRSDFQGLRRINNTTTAVTTAISAHDEFIVEQ